MITSFNNHKKRDFILIACDSVSDVCFDEICEFHILSDSMLTLVLKEDKVDEENNKIINPSSFTVRITLIFLILFFIARSDTIQSTYEFIRSFA